MSKYAPVIFKTFKFDELNKALADKAFVKVEKMVNSMMDCLEQLDLVYINQKTNFHRQPFGEWLCSQIDNPIVKKVMNSRGFEAVTDKKVKPCHFGEDCISPACTFGHGNRMIWMRIDKTNRPVTVSKGEPKQVFKPEPKSVTEALTYSRIVIAPGLPTELAKKDTMTVEEHRKYVDKTRTGIDKLLKLIGTPSLKQSGIINKITASLKRLDKCFIFFDDYADKYGKCRAEIDSLIEILIDEEAENDGTEIDDVKAGVVAKPTECSCAMMFDCKCGFDDSDSDSDSEQDDYKVVPKKK